LSIISTKHWQSLSDGRLREHHLNNEQNTKPETPLVEALVVTNPERR